MDHMDLLTDHIKLLSEKIENLANKSIPVKRRAWSQLTSFASNSNCKDMEDTLTFESLTNPSEWLITHSIVQLQVMHQTHSCNFRSRVFWCNYHSSLSLPKTEGIEVTPDLLILLQAPQPTGTNLKVHWGGGNWKLHFRSSGRMPT